MKGNKMQVPADLGTVVAVSLVLLLNNQKLHKYFISFVYYFSLFG